MNDLYDVARSVCHEFGFDWTDPRNGDLHKAETKGVSMNEWKYNIGDFVTPIVMNGYEHATKMVVTARVTEEYAQHTERKYVCSHYKLGEYVRQALMESEIVAWTEK